MSPHVLQLRCLATATRLFRVLGQALVSEQCLSGCGVGFRFKVPDYVRPGWGRCLEGEG